MQVTISKKLVKDLCTDCAEVAEAFDKKGNKYFAKLINVDRSEQLGYDECLQFNTEILEDVEECVFRQHLLDIKARISNEELAGLITEPYECNLRMCIEKETFDEKEIMKIFDQILKAVYSVYMNGYWHRNLRAEHFVRCGKIWKLESFVLNEDYSKANGTTNEYLWSSKHEAPQFVSGKQYQDEQYNQMTVWNLGCILLHLIVSSHKLSNKTIMEKFKGKPFTFEAINIKSDRVNNLSTNLKDLLSVMLHYDPKRRMKLQSLFENSFASVEVSKHAIENKQKIPPSKISIGRSVRNSKLNIESKNVLKDISKDMNDKAKEKEKVLLTSKINSVVDDEDFFDNLQEISNKIPSKEFKYGQKTENEQLKDIESLMISKNNHIRKSLQLYKSYYDQSQLLVLAIQNIDRLEFHMFKEETEVKQIKLLIKFSVIFVSLINLNTLAEGFNQNRNILDLDGDQFTSFQNSSQYSAFQKFANFKRTQRTKQLQTIKQEIVFFKKKNLSLKDEKVAEFIYRDYKKTNFNDIKSSYRMILKFAYDSISEEYNKYKQSERGVELAQRAMFVTYCLTIDKLYIKQHIPDNFKYYFEWIEKPASNYVPLNNFKDYILQAPKKVLIENSRFILKKYYNI